MEISIISQQEVAQSHSHSEAEFDALYKIAHDIRSELDSARGALAKYASFHRENDPEAMELCETLRAICQDKFERADKDFILILLLSEGLLGDDVSSRIKDILGADQHPVAEPDAPLRRPTPMLRRSLTGKAIPKIKDESEKVVLDRLELAVKDALKDSSPEKGVTPEVAMLRAELTIILLLDEEDGPDSLDEQTRWDTIRDRCLVRTPSFKN